MNYDNICYNNNKLKEIICRLDFASPIKTFNNNMPKEIFLVIKKYFPVAEPQDGMATQLQIGSNTLPMVNNYAIKKWKFLSRDRKNSCTIDADSVIFTINSYSLYEDLRKSVLSILNIIMKVFPDNQGKRLGLRYTNEFDMKDHTDWIEGKYFNALAAHKDNTTTRLVTILEYSEFEKDLDVILQYGYINPDYPSVIKREIFLIDIDAYSKGIIYLDDIEEYLDNMHSEDQKCFEMMITDNLRECMK